MCDGQAGDRVGFDLATTSVILGSDGRESSPDGRFSEVASHACAGARRHGREQARMADDPIDRSRLPIADPGFAGVANRTLEGSRPDRGLIGHVAHGISG